MTERLDVVVIGAGVVGLAVARALAMAGRDVTIVEAASAIGTGVSSRNSEVIHAGIHYRPGSLKARLCVRGKALMYAYCEARHVPCRRVGKLVVATDESQRDALDHVFANARAAGVDDLEALTAADVAAIEPAVACVAAAWCPSTGIVDSHALMLALLADAEAHGATLALSSRVIDGYVGTRGVVLRVGTVGGAGDGGRQGDVDASGVASGRGARDGTATGTGVQIRVGSRAGNGAGNGAGDEARDGARGEAGHDARGSGSIRRVVADRVGGDGIGGDGNGGDGIGRPAGGAGDTSSGDTSDGATSCGATDAGDTRLAGRDDGTSAIEIEAALVVNCASLDATRIGRALDGVPAASVPTMHLAKGNYFTLIGRAPFRHLIYPLPEPGGLGIHVTPDLGGQVKFGPDVEWLPDMAPGTPLDYTVDPHRVHRFASIIRRYWPGLPADALAPAYAGIRPKLSGPDDPAADFVIAGPAVHGVPGLINLFGIDSPGLTSSLAIAEYVAALAPSS